MAILNGINIKGTEEVHQLDYNKAIANKPKLVKSYNDLEYKPFYSEVDEVDILSQQDYEFVTYEGMMVYQEPLPNGVHLQLGQTYKVLWDNVEYTCTTVGESSGTSYEVMMGNLVMGGFENTGEPFAIANVYDTSDGVNATFIIMAVDGGTTHNVRIYQNGEIVHQIDQKYVDSYTKAEINEMLGIYIDEVNTLLGGED